MRWLIVSTIISLDGYIAGPGGNPMVLPMDASFDEFNLEELKAADVVLLGGVSHGMFSGFWPGVADDPSASATNPVFLRDGTAAMGEDAPPLRRIDVRTFDNSDNVLVRYAVRNDA